MITQAIIIYLCIGSAFATLMMLGAARMEVGLELLGRAISPTFPIACTLIGAALAWPLVVWLLVRGTKAKATTEVLAATLEQQANSLGDNYAANPNAVAQMKAKGRDVL